MTSLLLAALLLGTASAEDAPPESVRLNAEHEQLCARVSVLLDGVEAQRKAYDTAGDPDAALGRWTRAMAEAKEAADAAEALSRLHRKSRGALEVAQVAEGLNQISRRRDSGKVDILRLEAVARLDDAIGLRNHKVISRMQYEAKYLHDADAARTAARALEEGRRRVRTRVLAVAALLAAVSGVVVWSLRR